MTKNSFRNSFAIRLMYNVMALFIPAAQKRKAFKRRMANRVDCGHISQVQRLLHEKTQSKDTLSVVFFVSLSSIWPYERLYRLMQEDERFTPHIIIIPHTNQGAAQQRHHLDNTYSFFARQGISPVIAQASPQDTPLDVQQTYAPDIVFFSSPYNVSLPVYHSDYWWNKALCCYVPYGIMQANLQPTQYDTRFHKQMWRCFYETHIHKSMAEKYAQNNGANVVVTGYPKCDRMFDPAYTPDDAWKKTSPGRKRIIWAPHFTIAEDTGKNPYYSNFLKYADFFLGLARTHPYIQIAFKPHPNLRHSLHNHPQWGVEKTEAYYASWQQLDNGQLEDGDYMALFMSSDAMILDSVSFIAEYSYTGKPLLFTERGDHIRTYFNEFGQEMYEKVYKARSSDDILAFIDSTVLAGQDPDREERIGYITRIQPAGGLGRASNNILDNIISSVWTTCPTTTTSKGSSASSEAPA